MHRRAWPSRWAPRGGIVVVQEIFGVNAHVRSVADGFAALGYTAIAPAFFDHVETGVELGYDDDEFQRGRALVGQISFDRAIEDVASAAASIQSAGRIGVVGYCWGGTVALLAATRLALPAVSYYGARNVAFLGEKPRAPVQFHFGEKTPAFRRRPCRNTAKRIRTWKSSPIPPDTPSIATSTPTATTSPARASPSPAPWRFSAGTCEPVEPGPCR
jgi:Dienelactone hydrolase and related enzymes